MYLPVEMGMILNFTAKVFCGSLGSGFYRIRKMRETGKKKFEQKLIKNRRREHFKV